MTGGIPRHGEKGVYERTNPDYVDERIARMAQDYLSLDGHWRGVFLAGLTKVDREAVQALIDQKVRVVRGKPPIDPGTLPAEGA